MTTATLDFDQLLKLRFTVARFGEMDLARWWNTRGQLGRLGSAAVRRGFPRTHHFAQGRSVCAVASHRCRELFDPPECVTLWRLTETIEEEFDSRWEHWLDHADHWQPFFKLLEETAGADLLAALRAAGFDTQRYAEKLSRLSRSAEGRAVQVPGLFSGTDDDVALLALGFARGELGSPAVPYMRLS